MNSGKTIEVKETEYVYSDTLRSELFEFRERVRNLRDRAGALRPEFAAQLREIFKIKNIYESNAIEGSSLDLGETELVVSQGLTITGKPLEDTLAAKNLSDALEFFERLVQRQGDPIRAADVRGIHQAILKDIDDRNAGKYRTVEVKITGSQYGTPSPEKVQSEMQRFTDWLQKVITPNQYLESDPLVLACAAHAWFVYIHPFIDGNGRTARMLLNLLLIRSGYPLVIITRDERLRYYEALEESQAGNLTPFIQLVLEAAQESMVVYEAAAKQQISLTEFAEDVAIKQRAKATAEYQITENAMRLLKSYFQQAVDAINDSMRKILFQKSSIYLKDFGTLDFEKYRLLKTGQGAKKTWFFRLDFYAMEQIQKRYLFFFGANARSFAKLGEGTFVTLVVVTETTPFYYERLSELSDTHQYPDFVEIAYLPKDETFVCLLSDHTTRTLKAEQIAQQFIQQALDRPVNGS